MMPLSSEKDRNLANPFQAQHARVSARRDGEALGVIPIRIARRAWAIDNTAVAALVLGSPPVSLVVS